jgi:hypothetical protein
VKEKCAKANLFGTGPFSLSKFDGWRFDDLMVLWGRWVVVLRGKTEE